MKTDVDACLNEVADWCFKNRRQMTPKDIDPILRRHCESEDEVKKFISFLETEPGQLRFRTLLREKKEARPMVKMSGAQLGLGEAPEAAEARVRQACFPLVLRIKDGQVKLWERWRLIMGLPEGSGKDMYLKGWDEAREKLERLNSELEKAGFCWCLYVPSIDMPKFACLVCPMRPFLPQRCPAWGLEILAQAETEPPSPQD